MTELSLLTIVPASAGSGKTHYIQKKLTKWVNAGGNPEKIVAVTFTEAAAGELRSRIRGALVNNGRLNEAIALDRAYISTIHGFGLRLLTEFAFDAGKSTSSRKLNDDEQEMLISNALARSAAAGELMENLERFGYSDRFSSKNPMTAEQVFRKKVLDFIATLRSIARVQDANDFIPLVQDKIRSLYGTVADGTRLNEGLHEAVLKLLEQFNRDISEEVDVGDKPRLKLKQNFKDLDAARTGLSLQGDWELWKRLGEMVTFKTKSKLPDGYNDLAEDVKAAALKLQFHPGPFKDACLHAKLLIESATECLKNYFDNKKERSLLDFTDMLSAALLLLSDESVITELQKRVGILVIDEFQDTNPLQFSLLWALSRRGVPTIIVGDEKQAIMGFQNADPRLLVALPKIPGHELKPLGHNWRATKELMDWVNLMAAGLFPDNYEPLGEHEKKEIFGGKAGASLEVIDLTSGSLRNNEDKASHTAHRIYELITDESLIIYDKKAKEYRQIRGGDIAILTPTNPLMAPYTKALRKAGIPCRYREEGWHASQIVLIACQALAYVADHNDRHAALCLAVTGIGEHTLESAMKTLVLGGTITDSPIHTELRELSERSIDRTVEHVLLEIISVLGLYETVATWPDASQARANLLRLEAECREFTKANRDAMACGGFYGNGIKTFLAWLKDRVERDDMQPDSSVQDQDAVEIVTWHSSKGREWPVVVVCGMYNDCDPVLPAMRVEYGENGFDDLDTILEKAKIEIYPEFASPDTNGNFTDALKKEADESATRLLYVAMTRAREKLIIEWPSWTFKSKNKKNRYYIDLFTEKTGAEVVTETSGDNFMQFGSGEKYPCHLMTKKDKEVWICAEPYHPESLAPIGRLAINAWAVPSDLKPEYVTPSSLHNDKSGFSGKQLDEPPYGQPLELQISGIEDPMEKGKILHRAFEVLSGHPERAGLLSDAVGCHLETEQVSAICDAVSSFDAWLENTLKPVQSDAEVPILVLNHDGSVVHGFIDMVVEAADGFWVIDHKSDQVVDEIKRQERFNYYYPQLKCYADALSKARSDKPLKGVVVNWVSFGMVSKMEL